MYNVNTIGRHCNYCKNCECSHFNVENGTCNASRWNMDLYDIHTSTGTFECCERALDELRVDALVYNVECCNGYDEYYLACEGFYSDKYDCWFSYEYAQSEMYYCDECENYVYRDEWDDEWNCCNECAEQHECDGLIGDYHDNKGCYEKHGLSDRYIGIELEVENACRAVSNADVAREIQSLLGRNHVVFEHDSSLNSGFEIITHPHDYNAWSELPIEAMCETLVNCGFSSHDTTTCGLHVHFSTTWLGKTALEREVALYMILKFYDQNWENLAKISRRKKFDYCEREAYKISDSLSDTLNSKKTNRYSAVNCTPCLYDIGDDDRTVEFRLARGTLRAETIRAWIDLHVCILNYARTHVNDLLTANYDWNEWLAELNDDARTEIDNALNK